MKHAAVNTDPIPALDFTGSRGCLLKERRIQHLQIGENEVHHFYEIGAIIGQGNFGVVQLVKDKNDARLWAMKTVIKTSVGDRVKMVKREIQILKLIDHPHIVYLKKVLESPKKIYMIFELCKGELAAVYRERKPFDEEVTRKIIRELVDAVAYLHKFEIVHRDIKLENILMGENPCDPKDEYYVKLTDFGLSIVKDGSRVKSGALTEHCGTLAYMSPEMISNSSYTQQCDVWAVGVIIYLMLIGEYPFSAHNEREMKHTICNDDVDLDGKRHLSAEAVDLMKQTLKKNPANRITAAEMMHHPWIRNKKLALGLQRSTNILDMMKTWKNQMMVPITGEKSDWYDDSIVDSGRRDSSPKNIELPDHISHTRKTSLKQPLILPKTEISFRKTPHMNDQSHHNPNETRHGQRGLTPPVVRENVHLHQQHPHGRKDKEPPPTSVDPHPPRAASPPATDIIFPTKKRESGRLQTLREAAKPVVANKANDRTTPVRLARER